MTTTPQVPAALCGLYHGARVTIISTPKNGVGTAGRRMEDGCWSVRFDSGDFGWWAPEVLSLLLDSPLAMCHAARWLAERLGMDPGATAPVWRPGYQMGVHSWFLECPSKAAKYPGDRMDGRTFGYSTTDPAEALAAACVAVGGVS